jgi:hypothetical protein
MKEPQTYDELSDLAKLHPLEVEEWASENYEKYIDLRIEHLKNLPRDLFKKNKNSDSPKWAHFISTTTQSLFEDDHVDKYGYHGDLEAARYWDAFCDHFDVTRADLYAMRRNEIETFLGETIEDDDSTKEDIQGAYKQLKLARQDYHDARNYAKLLQKHKDKLQAKVIYDHYLDGILAKLSDGDILYLAEARPKIINNVMYSMRRQNGPKSRSPARTSVVRWLEGYRDKPIDGVPPGLQAEARKQLEGVPLENQAEALATLKATGSYKTLKPR